MHVVLPHHGEPCRHDQGGDLHHFRNLKIHHAEIDPSLRAVDGFADARQQHAHEKRKRGEEHPECIALPEGHRNLRHDPAREYAHENALQMLRDEVERINSVAGVVRKNGSGGIDHDRADAEQRRDADDHL